MKTTCSDGSSETKTLTIKVVKNEVRLIENPGNMYGDYIVIQPNGYLAFYDDQGIIYTLPPK